MAAAWRLIGGAALVLASTQAPAEASADACPGLSALIHSAPPADPDRRLVVARVEVEWADPELLHGRGVSARVIRMIQGDYDGELMILWSEGTSCSNPFANGRSGLIVGIPLGLENGILRVEAVEVSPDRGSYRLPDGYRVPEPYLEMVRRREAVRAAKPQ